MKILYLSSPSFADCDFPLIKEFQNKGCDITYVISLTPSSLKSTLFNIEKQNPVDGIIPAAEVPELMSYANYMDLNKVFILNRTNKKDSSFSALKSVCALIKFIKKGNYDVIHTDCIQSMWGILLYPFFRKKMVLTVHDPFTHSGEASLRKKFNYKVAMSFVKKFVLLNGNQKDGFCKYYGIDSNNVLINRLGVYDNITAFINPSIQERKNNVLFFGRISPYKGVEYLCKAMLKVKEVIPDASLTIAGGGKLYFDAEPYKKLDWIDFRIHYVSMEELAGLLQQSSVVVCPYTDATQSGVIMSAFGMNKPVIASNVGGLGEMVDDGLTGFLIPPKNIDALTDSIINILSNDDLRNNMKDYLKESYLISDKSWASISDKYLKFYKLL